MKPVSEARETDSDAPGPDFEAGDSETWRLEEAKKQRIEEAEKIVLCGIIGHMPFRGRCQKRKDNKKERKQGQYLLEFSRFQAFFQ